MAKANIMIVEDEAIIAQEIKICLKEMDYTVTSIVNTGQTIKRLLKNQVKQPLWKKITLWTNRHSLFGQ